MKTLIHSSRQRIIRNNSIVPALLLLCAGAIFLSSCGAPPEAPEEMETPAEEAPAPPPAPTEVPSPMTAPPVADPPVTPPVAEPPAAEPVAEPPAAEPSVVVPPAVEPPANESPATPEPPTSSIPPAPAPAPQVEPEPATPITTTPPTNPAFKLQTRGMSGTGAALPNEVAEESSKEFHTVDVYYGTNRKPNEVEKRDGNNEQYSGERNREGPMEYGKTTVSIPLHHKIGVVERPKWYKLEFSEDSKKHVTILELEKMDSDTFFSTVSSTAGERPKNEALLFIHGFNVAFDDAVRRTGQIAFDLDFGGLAMTYSWPSRASLSAYTVDESNAEWSIPHLTQFLMDLQEKTEIDKIHVIAHSMGTRVLSYALANAKDEGFDLDLHNVILAAPDIDADVFKDQILPKLADATDKLTMYASSDDTALKLSQSIHGNSRLGLSGASLHVFGGMDTVNASGIDTSMLGHGYYGSQKVVVTDIFNLIIKGLEPLKRELTPGPLGEWDFRDVIK